MEYKTRRSFFFCYLKEHVLTLLLLGLFAAIFSVVFSLYEFPLSAVLYPTALCLLSGMLIFLLRFHIYVERHRQRQQLFHSIELNYRRLPKGQTLAEEDYRQLLLALGQIYQEQETVNQLREQQSMDYYTTWVHQIKTPISVMRMLLQSEDTDEHRELSEELFRIEQYVDMVLYYLRLDSDSTDYIFHEIPLDPVIRQAVRKFASQFVRKRIRLVYEPTDVWVLTDEKWLSFILEQLLSNAIKYTNSGEIRITAEGKLVHISDTGIGIAPEDLPRIFERGFTGYNGRLDKKSTGIGLYLCKQACQRLSIGISAESHIGTGSVFTLDLNTDAIHPE